MKSSSFKRTWLRSCALFVSGLIVGSSSTIWMSWPARIAITDGDTLSSIVPEEIISLTYTTIHGTTIAQRSSPGTGFVVQATFADGRPTQRCAAPANLAGRLDTLSDLIARRGLTVEQREREFPEQLGVLDIRTRMLTEPNDPILVFSNRQRRALAVIFGDTIAEVTLRPDDIEWLGKGCPAVGAGDEVKRPVADLWPRR
jgi:hypothetical protein